MAGAGAAATAWLFSPGTTLADNCSGLGDCYGTSRSMLAAMAALAALASFGLDLMPGIGTVKGGIEAITGRDLITGEELEGWERALGIVPFVGAIAGARHLGDAADLGRGLGRVDDAAGIGRATGHANDLGDAGRAADAADDAGDASRAAGQADAAGDAGRGTGGTRPPEYPTALPPVPEGWAARTADNGKGVVYQRPGAVGNADTIRVMEPTPQYPNGYTRVYNSHGQPVDQLGKPGGKAATHVPLDSPKPWQYWPK